MNISPMKLHAGASAFMIVCVLFFAGRFMGALLNGKGGGVRFAPVPFSASAEPEISGKGIKTLDLLSHPIQAMMPQRNLFVEWHEPPKVDPTLTLDTVEIKGLPLFYQGMMRLDEKTLIAQVNYRGRSYFPAIGEKIQGWEVMTISETELLMKSPEGEDMIFPYRGKAVKNEEVNAVISMGPDNQAVNVKEGDSVNGFKVSAISESAVTLMKDGKKIVLEMGKKTSVGDIEISAERSS